MVLYVLPSLRCWNLAPVDRVANKQDVEMHRCVPSSVKRTVERSVCWAAVPVPPANEEVYAGAAVPVPPVNEEVYAGLW